MTPLHASSKCGHSGVAKVLLESGADVNGKDKNAVGGLLRFSQSYSSE